MLIKKRAHAFICFVIVVLITTFYSISCADQNPTIGFCINQNEYDDPWSTPAHIYSEPDEMSEVLLEIWGGKGTWFSLLDQVGDDWLKVKISNIVGYIHSTGIIVFRTDVLPSEENNILTCGSYYAGHDIPVGLYLYSGSSSNITVFSNYYQDGFHTYQITYERYPLYLPQDARIELNEEDNLQVFMPLNPFDKMWICRDNVRIFFPLDVPLGDGETIPNSYTCTLLDETSFIKAYDILGNLYPIDFSNIGEPFQVILNEGSFVEIYNCILEGNFNHG